MNLSFDPVDAYLIETSDRWGNPDPLDTAEVVRRLGVVPFAQPRMVSARTVIRWRQRGVDPFTADLIAVALGRSVCDLWPEWCEAADELVDRWAEKNPAKARSWGRLEEVT